MVELILTFFLGPASYCTNCGKLVHERKRKPCPRCGGLPRTHQRFANDYIGAKDNAG